MNLDELRKLAPLGTLVVAVWGVSVTTWGAVIATRGVNAWKRQLTGQNSYAVAQKTLRAALRVRDAIKGVRAVSVSAGEREGAVEKYNVQLDDGEDLDSPKAVFAAYQVRWRSLDEAMSQLEAEVLEAEVLFGPPVQWQFESMRMHANRLWLAVTKHIEWRELKEYERDAESRKAHLEHYAILHDPSDEPGSYKAQLATILNGFEALLRPHLVLPESRWSSFWGWVWSKVPKRKPKPMPWETGESLIRPR